MVNLSVCNRDNLCIDCDDEFCYHAGSAEPDCPIFIADVTCGDTDCNHCEFIREFQEEMRGKKHV